MNKLKGTPMMDRGKSWSKTVPTKNGTKTTSVREISIGSPDSGKIGFIVCISTDEEVDGNWKYDSTEYFSEENPLDDEFETSLISKLKQVMDS